MNQASFLVAVLLLAFTASAQASRYLVVFKNQQNFSRVHSQWVLANSSDVSRLFKGRVKFQVQESLAQVQALVIESEEPSLERALTENSEVLVEKEIFYEKPMPVRETALTTAWSFDANYAVSQDVLKKKKPRGPKVPNEDLSSDSAKLDLDRTPWGIKSVKAREAWEASHQGQGARVLVLDSGGRS